MLHCVQNTFSLLHLTLCRLSLSLSLPLLLSIKFSLYFKFFFFSCGSAHVSCFVLCILYSIALGFVVFLYHIVCQKSKSFECNKMLFMYGASLIFCRLFFSVFGRFIALNFRKMRERNSSFISLIHDFYPDFKLHFSHLHCCTAVATPK